MNKENMEEKKMIKLALIEYENNHYQSEDDLWQKQINKLLEKY